MEGPDWENLPKHLVTRVMQKTLEFFFMQTDPDFSQISTYQALKLVCKSWREALLDFSADIDTAAVCLQESSDLFGVCKMLPGISSLRSFWMPTLSRFT